MPIEHKAPTALERRRDPGATWIDPVTRSDSVPAGPATTTTRGRRRTSGYRRRGHQSFPDVDAYDGVLGVLRQDSREDPAYSVQRPIGNTASTTSSGDAVVNTYIAATVDGTTFGRS